MSFNESPNAYVDKGFDHREAVKDLDPKLIRCKLLLTGRANAVKTDKSSRNLLSICAICKK